MSLAGRLVDVRPGEGRLVGLLFLYAVFAVAAPFVVGRTVASTLFLVQLDKSLLPYAFIATAIGISLVSAAYAMVADRIPRDRMIMITCAGFALVTLAIRAGLVVASRSFALLGLLYVFVEIMGIIGLIQFWTLVNDLFTIRQAKRLIHVIGSGGNVSVVLFGAFVRSSVHALGAANLLLVMAAMSLVCVVLVRLIGPPPRPAAGSRERRDKGRGLGHGVAAIGRSPYLGAIALMTLLSVLVATLIDYQWKAAAQARFPTDPDAMAEFFGTFFLIVGALSLVFQYLVSGPVLRRFGLLVATLMLPISLLLASVGILFATTASLLLWTTTGAKASENILRYSVTAASRQLMFVPIQATLIARVRAIIGGIVEPLATALAGVVLVSVTMVLHDRQIALVTIPLLALFMVTAFVVRSGFVNQLAESLRWKRVDLSQGGLHFDQTVVESLEGALRSANRHHVSAALELLEEVPGKDWVPSVKPLVASAHSGVRRQALSHLGRHGDRSCAAQVATCFADDDPEVRATAISAWCQLHGSEGIESITPHAASPDPVIKTAALVGLVQHGGLDGIMIAAQQLKAMIDSDDRQMRWAGARVLEQISIRHFYEPVLGLLGDDDVDVRLTAIAAAGSMQSGALVSPLIAQLSDHRTAPAACSALVHYGSSVVADLARVLAETGQSVEARRYVPSILERIGTQACVDVLVEHVQDPVIRDSVVSSLHRLVQSGPELGCGEDRLLQLLEVEIRGFFQCLTACAELSSKRFPAVTGRLWRAMRAGRDRALSVVVMLYLGVHADTVVRGLGSDDPRARANALELLDNLVSHPAKDALMHILDDKPMALTLSWLARSHIDVEHHSEEAWLDRLAGSTEPWLAASALHAIGREALHAFLDTVESRCCDPHPLVRVAAQEARARLQRASDDRRWVMDTVQFLDQVSLFEDSTAEEIVCIAEVTQKCVFGQGETVIRQGEASDCLHVIVEGRATVSIDEREIAQLGAGECFGEMGVLDAEPRSATVVSLERLETLRLRRDDFFQLIRNQPKIARGVITVLARRIREMDRHVKPHDH